jgi:hypothetical protein
MFCPSSLNSSRLVSQTLVIDMFRNADDDGRNGDGLHVIAPTRLFVDDANESEGFNDCSYVSSDGIEVKPGRVSEVLVTGEGPKLHDAGLCLIDELEIAFDRLITSEKATRPLTRWMTMVKGKEAFWNILT